MEHFNELSALLATKILATSIGIFGGLARFLSDVLDKKRDFSWGRLVMMMISSGFFGYMGGELALIMFSDGSHSSVVAGVLGFLGPQGMDYVIGRVFKK